MRRIIIIALVCTSLSVRAEENLYLPSGNGDVWDNDANWSLGHYPNASDESAFIGVPTGFKKGKGWRNVHIDATDVTVGNLVVLCGGCTNRIDSGDVGGNLTFFGGMSVADVSGAGLAMLDLDEPHAVCLGGDSVFCVSNTVGDAAFGGLLIKGILAGNGNSLKKTGPGRMTLACTNAAGGEVVSKLQCEEGVVAIESPLHVGSITKSGPVWLKVCSTELEAAPADSVICDEKLSADSVCLFIPTSVGNGIWYGGVVAGSSLSDPAKKDVRAYVLGEGADAISFAGERWMPCASAKVETTALADGRVTYEVTVPEIGGDVVPTAADVAIAGRSRPLVGEPLQATVSAGDEKDWTFVWARGDCLGTFEETPISTSATYTPTPGDYEHWLRLVASYKGMIVCSNDLYFSKLPIAYINTDDGKAVTSKGEYKGATLRIQGNDLYDQQYEGAMEIKGRGNSSWTFPKKPYKIKLEKKTDLFGFGKNKHWVLLSNWYDECYLRNYFGQGLAEALGLVRMEMTWVDVVLNGQYQGNYMLGEHIRVDTNRIDVYDWSDVIESDGHSEEDLSWLDGEPDVEFDGGYIFECDGVYDEVSKFTTDGGLKVMVNTPEYAFTSKRMESFVKRLWGDFEAAYSSVDGYCNSNGVNYADLADADSMAAFWLVNELLANADSVQNSRYAHKDCGKLLTFGPAWDFDYGGACLLFKTIVPDKWQIAWADIYLKWLNDPMFCLRACRLYWEKARPWFSSLLEENGLFDVCGTYLLQSGRADDLVWGPTNGQHEFFSKKGVVQRGFEEDLRIYRKYLQDRITWMDAQFSSVEKLMSTASSFLKANGERSLPMSVPDGVKTDGLTSTFFVAMDRDVRVNVAVTASRLKVLDVHVNGTKIGNFAFKDLACSFSIPATALDAGAGRQNVILAIAKNSLGEPVVRNYVVLMPLLHYTVIYKKNSDAAVGEMPAQEFVYGVPQALLPNQFARDGRVFEGWTSSGCSYEDCEVVNNLTNVAGAVVRLWARWGYRNGSPEKPWQIGYPAEADVIAYTNGEGRLIVSGLGATKDFGSGEKVPWRKVVDSIGAITVSDGVSKLGRNIFSDCTKAVCIDFEGEPPHGLGEAGMHDRAQVRYNAAQSQLWWIACEKYDLTGAVKYVPQSSGDPGTSGGGDGASYVTVSNVIVHYVQNSVIPDVVLPFDPNVGFVTVITEVKSDGGFVAVPDNWAKQYPAFESKFGSNISQALVSPSGKTDGTGAAMQVWQDYVAGTDPTDPTDQFRASVTMQGGQLLISWTPELPPEEAAKRSYVIYGKVRLSDPEWTVVDGNAESFNFFKVVVKMRQK